VREAFPDGSFLAKIDGKPDLFTLESKQVTTLKKDLTKPLDKLLPATPVSPVVKPAKKN